MVTRYPFLVLILISFLGCKNDPKNQENTGNEISMSAVKQPNSTFMDLEGNAVELTDFVGKRLVLNFWATWCRPCIEEMPSLLRAQELLLDENYVFLLASDQSLEKIKAFKEKKNFDFTYLKLNVSLADMDIHALPATFIYSGSGKLVNRIDGATEWDAPEILEQLKSLK